MKSKDARRLLKEREKLAAKVAEAAVARSDADAEFERLNKTMRSVDLEFTATETRLIDLYERQRDLDAWRSEVIAESLSKSSSEANRTRWV